MLKKVLLIMLIASSALAVSFQEAIQTVDLQGKINGSLDSIEISLTVEKTNPELDRNIRTLAAIYKYIQVYQTYQASSSTESLSYLMALAESRGPRGLQNNLVIFACSKQGKCSGPSNFIITSIKNNVLKFQKGSLIVTPN